MDLVEIQHTQELQEIAELLGTLWVYMNDKADYADDTGPNKEMCFCSDLLNAGEVLDRMIG